MLARMCFADLFELHTNVMLHIANENELLNHSLIQIFFLWPKICYRFLFNYSCVCVRSESDPVRLVHAGWLGPRRPAPGDGGRVPARPGHQERPGPLRLRRENCECLFRFCL